MFSVKFSIRSLMAIGFALVAEGLSAKPMDDLKLLHYATSSGMLTAIYAKEMCSCHFIQKMPIDDCKSHVQLPKTQAFVDLRVDENAMTVKATVSLAGKVLGRGSKSHKARFRYQTPYLGCQMTE